MDDGVVGLNVFRVDMPVSAVPLCSAIFAVLCLLINTQAFCSLLLNTAAARTQATHNETTSADQTKMLKSGEIFAEATMDHGPARLLIQEQEEAYRQSFVRHVASRTNKVCNDSASPLPLSAYLNFSTHLLRYRRKLPSHSLRGWSSVSFVIV
jgi:hypothetical protein